MIINYFGYASFKIKSKDATIIINPFNDKLLGCKFKKSEADIVLVSKDSEEYNNIKAIEGKPFVIRGPGEFEIKEVMILGFPSDESGIDKRNTIYRIEVDGVNLVHLGALNRKLSDEQYEQLGWVDILFVPIGGKGTIDTKLAAEIVSKIEPSIVIPTCYFDNKISAEFKDLTKVEKFFKVMGVPFPEKVKNFKIDSRDFGQTTEGTKFIILEKK